MSETALIPAPPPLDAEVPGAPKGRASRKGKGGKPTRAEHQAARVAAPVLGVHVTPQALYGVLLRPTGDGFEPVRQFSRQRSGGDSMPSADMGLAGFPGAVATPDMQAPDDGVTLRIGEGAGIGPDLFLESEFAALAGGNQGAGGPVGHAPAMDNGPASASPVVFELKDLIEECRQAGFEKPALAFTIGAPDVDYVEVVVADLPPKGAAAAKKKGGKAKKAEAPAEVAEPSNAPVKRETLLGLLPKSDVRYDKERIAFIPMTQRDGRRRYLGVLPRPEEPVAPSLKLLREQQGMRRLNFRTLDAEVPVLLGLARLAFPSDPHESTALVRVGVEDTLVMLLVGNQLHHCEHMRSVTTFDGPDTICSRVLLQQDVQGIGTVHNVVIVSEEREDELVQGFGAFYPEARVETLRSGVARAGIAGPYGPLPTAAMAPTGVALKALLRKDAIFEPTNLLPKELRRRTVGPKVDLAFSWHTMVAAVLLFMSVLFFVGLYLTQEREIADAQQQLAELPSQDELSGPVLQARIDSLRQAKAQIEQSLQVMDSLLIGSDQWTQLLARTTRAASAVGGVWVEEWAPADSGLGLRGYATGRARVVNLAERLNATIEEVTFQQIREAPVYQFRIRFPIPNEMPEVARYLRERAMEQAAQAGAAPPDEPLADEVPLAPGAAAPPAGAAPPAP